MSDGKKERKNISFTAVRQIDLYFVFKMNILTKIIRCEINYNEEDSLSVCPLPSSILIVILINTQVMKAYYEIFF